MVICKFCNQDNLEWYQDQQDKWKLGIKLDINNFRPHKCSPPQNDKTSNNRRNWVDFKCEKCGCRTKQNVKLYQSKELNLCYDCDNSC